MNSNKLRRNFVFRLIKTGRDKNPAVNIRDGHITKGNCAQIRILWILQSIFAMKNRHCSNISLTGTSCIVPWGCCRGIDTIQTVKPALCPCAIYIHGNGRRVIQEPAVYNLFAKGGAGRFSPVPNKILFCASRLCRTSYKRKPYDLGIFLMITAKISKFNHTQFIKESL